MLGELAGSSESMQGQVEERDQTIKLVRLHLLIHHTAYHIKRVIRE
jgi:hypothetical protein